ncbi:hypothetical protein [Bradyrhizobium erythrophlei]|jgi:hypothetical protein|nr:hypothetical protein [Bradyrhizobium erythrophlei]
MANTTILQDFQLDKLPVTGVAAARLTGSMGTKNRTWEPEVRAGK